MRDIRSKLGGSHSIAPALRTASVEGSGVDLRGYDSAMAVLHVGAYTDGAFTAKLQESDDNITYTDVAAADLVGAFAAVDAAGDANSVQRVGYIGSKRYIKAVVEEDASPSPSTGAAFGVSIILGNPSQEPVA